MKRSTTTLAGLIVATLASTLAQADDGYIPRGVYYGYRGQPLYSSTVGEGYARGFADVVRAAGEYNVNTSRAMINVEEARRRNIDNRVKSVDAYFTMRKMNREYRAAERGPQPNSEQVARLAHEAAPDRTSAHQLDPISGAIRWPEALLGNEYSAYRQRLDLLFAKRPHTPSGIGSENFIAIQSTVRALKANLSANITHYDPTTYVATKRFIESLGYEARYAPARPASPLANRRHRGRTRCVARNKARLLPAGRPRKRRRGRPLPCAGDAKAPRRETPQFPHVSTAGRGRRTVNPGAYPKTSLATRHGREIQLPPRFWDAH